MSDHADYVAERVQHMVKAAHQAFGLAEDRTGEFRRRTLLASYRLDARAITLDSATRCEENEKRHRQHVKACDKAHDDYMKRNGWFLKRKAVVRWDSRALPKPKWPKISRRMVTAGKRLAEARARLAGALTYRHRVHSSIDMVVDYALVEADPTTRPLLEKAREEFRRCAKACGMTMVDV